MSKCDLETHNKCHHRKETSFCHFYWKAKQNKYVWSSKISLLYKCMAVND